MKIPKTSEDFVNEFYSSIDLIQTIGDLRIRQLILALRNVSDELIIEGIIKIFENKNRPNSLYTDQKYTGLILKELRPNSNIDLTSILNSLIENWNKSVGEFPLWLIDNYGIEFLKIKLSEFEAKNLSETQLDKLKTMNWWLRN